MASIRQTSGKEVDAMKDRIKAWAEEIKADIVALSDEIYANPELGNEEFRSSESHKWLLEKYGFTVEMPYMDCRTGYRAEYAGPSPGPVICYMAEYDALPGVGHGCGHNMLGSTSVAAGILLSRIVREIGGKVVVLGTPAEETEGAKVLYASRGAFAGIDAAIVSHPCAGPDHRSGRSLALEPVEFTFDGKAAHAASSPEEGINALDAVILTFTGINALRQQIKPDARIHGIITEGGVACNIIPEHCVCRFYVRAGTKAYLQFLLEKVRNCARGAAEASGCTLTIGSFETGYDDLMTNEALSEIHTQSLKEFGVSEVSEPRKSTGSLDAGNVSYVCPTIHPYFSISPDAGIAAHTREFAACTQTEYAKAGMMRTASAMALTGYKLISDGEALKRVRDEFRINAGAMR